MTYCQVVQHQLSLSIIARKMRLVPSVSGGSVCAARHRREPLLALHEIHGRSRHRTGHAAALSATSMIPRGWDGEQASPG